VKSDKRALWTPLINLILSLVIVIQIERA
jgi:hypothetical protein